MNNTIAHIEKKEMLVPKIRFNGFVGGWSNEKLGDIFSIFNGYAFSSSDARNEGCRWVKIADVGINEINHDSSSFLPSEYKERYSNFLLNEGDFIVALTRPILNGQLKIAKVDNVLDGSLLNQRVGKITTENDLAFVHSLLQKESLIARIENRIAGTDPPNLSPIEINTLTQFIPNLAEQQKIASFLRAINEKIQGLNRKKKLLEQYRDGVMQQLFSGKLRFKDENGKAFPKWDMEGGDKLFESISDKKHNSDLPILAITQDQGAIPREMINYQMSVTDSSIASYKVVQVGDFIISLRTFQGGIEYSNYKGICSPAYNILRRRSDKVDRDFYKYYFKTPTYIMQLQRNLEGIRDGKMISYKYFSEIKLPFPSKPEQKKIANYLFNIDQKIQNVTNQINQTQTFKKGLLQQMFV